MDTPFFRLADALDALPALADQGTRDLVIGALPPAISGAVRHHAQRRLQIMEILRTCLDYPGGVEQLLGILSEVEGESVPLGRLVETVREVLPQMGG
jgi:hypothetical protein